MRGKRASKRDVKPDKLYKSIVVSHLINSVMLHGKKSVAKSAVYGAMKKAGETVKKDPLEVLEQAIRNVSPALEVRPRRVGGATYQVPMPVSEERQIALSIRWMIQSARNSKGKTLEDALAKEILDAYNEEGAAVHKKEEAERMAEANKAFAHFRW